MPTHSFINVVRTTRQQFKTRIFLIELVRWLAVVAAGFVLLQLVFLRQPTLDIPIDSETTPISRTGFYDIERFASSNDPYRWTQRQARLAFPNPGGQLRVELVLAGGSDRDVQIEAGTSEPLTMLDVASAPRRYTFLAHAHAEQTVELIIQAPPFTEPGNGRELGVIVGSARIQGGGGVPSALLYDMLLASIVAYGVIRLLVRHWHANAIVVLAQAAFAVWLALGGWAADTRVVLGLGSVLLVLVVAGVQLPQRQHMLDATLRNQVFSQLASWYQWTIQQSFTKPIAVVLLGSFVALLYFLRLRTAFQLQDLGLDPSWFLELENQLRQGNIMGRDSYFTYGPLSQFVMSAGILLRGGSSIINGFATGYFFFELLGIVLFGLAIMVVRQIKWPGALLLFSVGFLLDGVLNMRQAMVILSMVLLVYTLDAPTKRRYPLAVFVGCVCVAAQLLTAEVGVYAIVGLVGLLVGLCLLSVVSRSRFQSIISLHPWQVYAEILGICLTTIVLLNGMLELWFRFSATYQPFDYLRYTGAILTNYNYTMGTPWTLAREPSLLLVALLLFCAIAVVFGVYRAPRSHVHLLLGLGLTAALNLKSALVRSDVGHIIMASAPLVFLFVVLICLTSWRSVLRSIGLGLLGCTLVFWPIVQTGTLQQVNRIVDGTLSLRAQWQAVRATTVDSRGIAPQDMQAAIRPDAQLVNFPYDNVIALALGQRSLAPILQTYSAHNELLQHHYVDVIDRQRNTVEVVYGLDGVSVAQIDGVQNSARVPIIFRYLLENFALKTPAIYRNGYVVLEPRSTPQPRAVQELNYRVEHAQEQQTITLDAPAQCSLVDMEISMEYPFTAIFGRPRGVTATFLDRNAAVAQSNLVAVEHTRPFHTYVYLGEPRAFAQLFTTTNDPQTRAAFTHIMLEPPPASVFDVRAQNVQIKSLRCVN